MVISKPVRLKKKILPNYINEDITPKRISTRDKILQTLAKNKNGLPLMYMAYKANIKSGGNIHQVIKFMIRSKEIIKETCPHCNNTDLYKLNI